MGFKGKTLAVLRGCEAKILAAWLVYGSGGRLEVRC